jgi:hypothetical protein
MHELTAKSPKNADRIFPFISGEEVNSSPTQEHHRYVINFEDIPLRRKANGHSWFRLTEETQQEQLREGIVAPDYPGPAAEDWPDLLAIVEERVKPERDKDNRPARKREWWKFAERTPGLFGAVAQLPRVLVNALYGSHLAFVFKNPEVVFANKVNVMTFTADSDFAVLQSRIHEVWARFFSSTLKDDLAYAPSDCFETFPFPSGPESNAALERTGKEYYEFRADLMIRIDEGLTKTYNRFHDPNEDSADIQRLRELHAAMDRAVLDAYGWQDLQPVCEFFPEFDDDEDEDESGRPKKKKYRYRWPEVIHDEVLARLLDLNRQRALEEGQIPVLESPADSPWADASQKPAKKSSRKSKDTDMPGPLFGTTEQEE